MNSHFFVDMHCHPSMKAFARSFAAEPGCQPANSRSRSSIFYRDAPTFFDKVKQLAVGLTNFTQSDGHSLVKGRVGVVCISLYPQEKNFFVNKAGTGIVSDLLTRMATEFGKERINHLQAMQSYWLDLKQEIDFINQMEGKPVMVEGKKVRYIWGKSYEDITQAEEAAELGVSTIILVPSIEGAHIFDQVMNSYEPWTLHNRGLPPHKEAAMLERIALLRGSKNGYIRPVFITLAHHFWNGLCGHAKSISGAVKCLVDQSNGLETPGLLESGKAALHAMLSHQTDDEGQAVPRIYIDIKHMSRRARMDYFDFLTTHYPGEKIPVIVSHGGVTGLSGPGGQPQTTLARQGLFMTEAINLFDDEVLKVAETGGIFGIQLDERRIGSKITLRKAKGNLSRRDLLYSWARTVWQQIAHIAELLDMHGSFAWGIQCLGTDFDGIIDPINGYWSAAELDHLDDFLLMHAYNYLKDKKNTCPLKMAENKNISPEEVVDRFMTGNALRFLETVM
ncbi:MAG: dipeptidase [Chitinophagaceae bacterium]|nr:dipeptidase [Chitinophagaceae bacterium]